MQNKIIRITTIPMSLRWLLKGQLEFINNYFEVIAVSSSGKDLELVSKLGIKTEVIEMTRAITPVEDIVAILKMYFLFKQEKPFIVHTHTPKAGLVGMVAAKIARVPFKLHTVAGLPLMESTGIKRTILEFVEKVIYKFADRVYPNSYVLKDFILQNNLCKNLKLKVIGNGSSNGIDTDYFDSTDEVRNKAKKIEEENKINENDIVFCFIGRIVKDKGINELVEVFNEMSKSISNIKLILVGPFENDLDPISEASNVILKNNMNIIHVGFQDDVRPYLAMSDIFVFPSYREGFPNVVMQAGAMGLPSIVTNINGCNEIIEDGKNGLIIEPKNTDQLKDAIIKLIKNKELRSYLAFNARQMIVERYEQKYLWNEILKEYKSLEEEYESLS